MRARTDGGKAKQRENFLEAVHMQLRGVGRGMGREKPADKFHKERGFNFEKRTLALGIDRESVSSTPMAIELLEKAIH